MSYKRTREWHTSTTKFTEEELAVSNKPLLLFVGIYSAVFNSDFMKRGFEEAGYECNVFNWQKVRFEEGYQGMIDRLAVKIKLDKPDVVFLQIQNKDIVLKEAVKEFSKYSFVVNYTFDVREDISWYKEIAPNIGLTLFGDMESVDECRMEGITNVDYMQSSADYSTYTRLPIREATNEYGEVVFIGNNTVGASLNFEKAEERVEMVNYLQKNFKDRFKVYGQNWLNTKMVHPHEESMILNACKVAVTHNHFFRRGYTSDRIFRSMGCGAYTISQYYNGVNVDFNASVLATWLNFDMLGQQIELALSNDERRKMVASNGYNFVRGKHSWKNRAETLKKLIKKYEPK